MPEHTTVTKITAVLHQRLIDAVLMALRQSGIVDVYTHAGRTSSLRERDGWTTLLKGRRSLVNHPVDILSFFVEPAYELDAMRLVAYHGKLSRPGMGSLYSETYTLHSAHRRCHSHTMTAIEVPDSTLYQDLVGIYCVVQRGQGDRIAQTVLEMGTAVPTITYGIGMGIRDRLGLLRITIPADKEVCNLIVPAWDAEAVFEAIIVAGHLDLPGRGFISTFPVHRALMNTKISADRARYAAASIEQIIAAMDKLTGATQWRAEHTEFFGPRRQVFRGRDLHILCNEGTGVALVKAAMQVGAAGATMEKVKLLPRLAGHEQQPSHARELCRLMVSAESQPVIVQAIEDAGALSDDVEAMIYHGEALSAFTYMPARGALHSR